MTAYRSHMGRTALEDGPDDLITVPCPDCNGAGWRYRSPLASRRGPCDTCDTTGEVDANEAPDD